MDQPLSAFVFAHPFWVWLAVGAVFLAAEALTGSGWLLWPAAGAALVALVSLLAPSAGAAVDIAVFAVATLVLTFVGRPLPQSDRPGGGRHQRPRGDGSSATAARRAAPSRAVAGECSWMARSGPRSSPRARRLPPGAGVEVVAVLGGARLKVKAV